MMGEFNPVIISCYFSLLWWFPILYPTIKTNNISRSYEVRCIAMWHFSMSSFLKILTLMYTEQENIPQWTYLCEQWGYPPAAPMKRGPDAKLALLYKKPHHECLVGSYTCTPPCCPSALEKEKHKYRPKLALQPSKHHRSSNDPQSASACNITNQNDNERRPPSSERLPVGFCFVV